MEYILYHKNTRVLSFSTDLSFNTKINEIYSPNDVPIILYHDLKAPNTPLYEMKEKIDQWLELRTLSSSRENLKDVLKRLDVSGRNELAKRNYFLTLSDSYWVCESSCNLKWEDINFFENKFSNYVGNVIFDNSKNIQKVNLRSPDATTPGALTKKWIINENGERVLLKKGTGTEQQEPVNEVIATMIYKKLGIPCVEYKLLIKDEHSSYYCACKTNSNQNTEMIPAFEIAYDIINYDGICDYKEFIKRAEILGIQNVKEQLAPMFLVDFIISNNDRHLNNITFDRNPDTLEWKSMTPVFDSGSSLFVNYWDWEIKDMEPFLQNSKPFADKQKKQLSLILKNDIKAFNNIDLSLLDNIHIQIREFLEPLKRLNNDKKDALSEYIRQQIILSKNLCINPKQLLAVDIK